MALTNVRYECDDGDIYAIRLDTKTLAATGGAPAAGSLTNTRVKIRASATSRSPGLKPRRINIRRLVGNVTENGVNIPLFRTASYVCCTPAGFQAAASADTVTYGGAQWQVVSGSAES